MARTLTAADRKSLIRLASTLPKGSSERRAILSGLKKQARFDPDSDQDAEIGSWIKKLEYWKALHIGAVKAYNEMQRKHGLRGDGALVEAGLTGLAGEGAFGSYQLTQASRLGLLDWPMERDPENSAMMASLNDDRFDSKIAAAVKALDLLRG